VPFALGPPDGRYLLRPAGAPADADPSHVLVLATLGAPERRRLARARNRKAKAEPQPEPTPVTTGRATIIELGAPFSELAEAQAWLQNAGESELESSLAVLNRALHAFRLVTADPYLSPLGRHQTLVARVGFGAGEEVADGLWSEAQELHRGEGWQRRAKVLQPQARLAAVLGGRERVLACEELALRARLDLEQGREREAALQLLVALDATLAELAGESSRPAGEQRLAELDDQRGGVAGAAQAALAGPLSAQQRELVEFTLGRIEAALRARAVANA
jgi:hypothetical protein